MYKTFLSVFITAHFLIGCTEQKSQPSQRALKDSTESQTFFPVTEYINGQLSEVEGLPVTPLKIFTQNGRSDSTWMKKENIREFAQPFLFPVIGTANFKDLFVQKSFLDQTINAITFSYDPIDKLPDTLQLRRWDVYIDPKKNTIKRIYIIKEINNEGILNTLQLTWKSNQWCKITYVIEEAGKPPQIKEELMKWDFNE